MENYKVIFIGAGVGNLLAANHLFAQGFNDFIILEKGKNLKNRMCPGMAKHCCRNCSICDIIEGVGGANALNGNKICHFPASQNILDFTGMDSWSAALNYIQSFSHAVSNQILEKTQETGHRKYYHSDILVKSDFAELIQNLTKDIKSFIRQEMNVTKVSVLFNGHFKVYTRNEVYETDNVVFGTGRSSYRFLSQFLWENRYEQSPLTQDVGIRIEGLRELFSSEYYYQVDPKLKFSYHDGVGRTFCAHNQGSVVPVKIGTAYYADGAFGEVSSGVNNIALMVRSRIPLTIDKLEQWGKRINESSSTGLLLGVVSVGNPNKMINRILKLINIFPSAIHAQLFENLLHDLFDGEHAILNFHNTQNQKLKIYGPAIDRYWVRPILNRDFSLRGNKNAYVIGDAAGLSRGFMQAMFSGYVWADRFLSKIKEIYTDNDTIWRCGLSPSLFIDPIQKR